MQEQKTRGKLTWQGSGGGADAKAWFVLGQELGDSEFIGYEENH